MTETERDPRAAAIDAALARVGPLADGADLPVDAVLADPRRLAVTAVFTGQVETLRATLLMAAAGLGHLATAFVRPALDEMLWLKYLETLDAADARDVLLALLREDGLRGLDAMRAYIGPEAMLAMGFPADRIRTGSGQHRGTRAQLAALASRLGWPRERAPSMAWIADQVDERDLYDYLYAAASRTLHFSAGEIFRRAWGPMGDAAEGTVRFDHAGHRRYLTDLALDTLFRLFLDVLVIAVPRLQVQGRPAADLFTVDEDWLGIVAGFAAPGRVPMVHPEEYTAGSAVDGGPPDPA